MNSKTPTALAGPVVLGIDAAWTAHQPSGVALVQLQDQHWHCIALAPSYSSFLALAQGSAVDWSKRPTGSKPPMAELLAAAQQLCDQKVELLAFDMPLSTKPISQRREADRQVSSAYGSRGCSVHSPSKERPGGMADAIRQQLHDLGYPLHTANHRGSSRGVIEVYPHVALLSLLQRNYRLEYKVSRSQRYWPGMSVQERIHRLLMAFEQIQQALQRSISGIALPLPQPQAVTSLAGLKPLEDSLDALVCAWMGMQHLDGQSQGLGDDTAAIWVPQTP